jgi:hypothetical protein
VDACAGEDDHARYAVEKHHQGQDKEEHDYVQQEEVDLLFGAYSYSDIWGCIYLIGQLAVSFYAAIYLMKRQLVN